MLPQEKTRLAACSLSFSWSSLLVIVFKKAVFFPLGLPARHGIQADGMNAVEDALFNIGIILLEPFEQLFDLLPL